MARDLPSGTTTFLFTDVEKSTELARRSGVDFPGLMGDHNRMISASVSGHGGLVVKGTGDGVLAVFSNVGSALDAAAELQTKISSHAWPPGLDVKVRVGVHTGEATLQDGDYVGLEVHKAARVMAAGHGGQVLVSDPSRSLAGDRFDFVDLGRHRLRGLEEEEAIHQLLVPGLPAAFPPLATAKARPHNLPTRLASTIGRATERTALVEEVTANRLVTILGPGGVGKTSLALDVAAEAIDAFPGGVTFVDLSSVDDGEFVIPSIAAEVGADPQTVEGIADRLEGQRSLLVLDNFEQVISSTGRIGDLLGSTDEAHLLVTSQVPLRLKGERRHTVGPLDAVGADSPGVALFLDRARAIRPGFDADPASVTQLVEELDGLPLAIELVAARANLMEVDEMLQRVRAGNMSYRAGPDAPDRHRSLEAALEWSTGLLERTTRELLVRLSVFPGGFTLGAAEAVAGDGHADVIDDLAELVDRSLVSKRGGRFVMLDGIRRFALSKLEGLEIEDEANSRFVAYYLNLATEASGGLQSDRGHWWRALLDDEIDNLRGVLAQLRSHGRADDGLGLLGNIWRFYVSRGRLYELESLISEFLAMPADGPDSTDRIKGLMAGGAVHYWQGRGADAVAAYEEALQRSTALGEERLAADAAFGLGTSLVNARRADEAGPYLEKSKAAYEALGDRSGLADVIAGEAFMLSLVHGPAGQGERFARAAALYDEVGRRVQFTELLLAQAAVAIDEGRFEDAAQFADEGLDSACELADVFLQGWAIEYRARVVFETGDYELAGKLAGGVEGLRGEYGAIWSPEIAGLDKAATLLRRDLGAGEAERLLDLGHGLALDELIPLARL